jgi:hypothetical protein
MDNIGVTNLWRNCCLLLKVALALFNIGCVDQWEIDESVLIWPDQSVERPLDKGVLSMYPVSDQDLEIIPSESTPLYVIRLDKSPISVLYVTKDGTLTARRFADDPRDASEDILMKFANKDYLVKNTFGGPGPMAIVFIPSLINGLAMTTATAYIVARDGSWECYGNYYVPVEWRDFNGQFRSGLFPGAIIQIDPRSGALYTMSRSSVAFPEETEFFQICRSRRNERISDIYISKPVRGEVVSIHILPGEEFIVELYDMSKPLFHYRYDIKYTKIRIKGEYKSTERDWSEVWESNE